MVNYNMDSDLRKLLEHEAVINYFEACKAMQSSEVVHLIRNLRTNMHVDSFDMLFVKYVDCLMQYKKSFSSDDFMAYTKRVVALNNKIDISVVDNLDLRVMDDAILKHFDILNALYALKDLDTDLRNTVCDTLVPDSRVLLVDSDKSDDFDGESFIVNTFDSDVVKPKQRSELLKFESKYVFDEFHNIK